MTEQTRMTLGTVLLVLFRILFTGFAVYTTWFIFSNSMEVAAVSSAKSAQVLQSVNGLMTQLGLDKLSSYEIRKLAHFAEFAVLGFWFMCCLRVYTRKYIRHISWPLLLGLVIANVDETIQLYVAGRSSSVSDVWIDFGGVCAGVLAAFCLLLLLGSLLYLMGFGRGRARQPA
ncbi:MAG: VanZ family protein [Oscillospiraceae bacterium]|nr:VanZ family protein [Oscillospiraceae bacterium]